MFSDLNAIELKINSKRIARKTSYVWKLKKNLNPHVKEEITVETREYFELNENKVFYIGI